MVGIRYDAGELDQIITLSREVQTPDDMGGVDVAVNNYAQNIFAKAKPMSGSEKKDFDKLNATNMVLFVLHYRADVLENDFIVWKNKNYNIRRIRPFSTIDLFIEVEAESGVAL